MIMDGWNIFLHAASYQAELSELLLLVVQEVANHCTHHLFSKEEQVASSGAGSLKTSNHQSA